MTSCLLALAKSVRLLAAATASPLMNAIAVGPESWSLNASTPASLAAMAVRVFLTTENLVSWPRETRSCLSCATVSPRYSVRTAAFDSLKSLVISATAETLLGVAITLLPGIVPVCPGPRSKELKTKKRPAQMHGACLDAVHDRGALLRSPAPAALCSGSFVRKSTALSRRDCRSESCLGEWISNNRRSLVLQAYGTRRACSKSGAPDSVRQPASVGHGAARAVS